jgi:hypothetical protein
VSIEEWRRHYNEVRPHSSLGYLTPAEFKATLAATTTEGRSAASPLGWLRVVGVFGDGSSAGISMWAVITAPAPAAMPALNGNSVRYTV